MQLCVVSAKLTLRLRRGGGWICWRGNYAFWSRLGAANPGPEGRLSRGLQAWLGKDCLRDALTLLSLPSAERYTGVLVAKPRELRPSTQPSGRSFQTDPGVGSASLVTTRGGGRRRSWVKVRATSQDQGWRTPEADGQAPTGPPYVGNQTSLPGTRLVATSPKRDGELALGLDPPVAVRTLNRALFPEPRLDAAQTGAP